MTNFGAAEMYYNYYYRCQILEPLRTNNQCVHVLFVGYGQRFPTNNVRNLRNRKTISVFPYSYRNMSVGTQARVGRVFPLGKKCYFIK